MSVNQALVPFLSALAAQGDSFFVLRGGVALSHYVRPTPRPIDDLDLLSPLPDFEPAFLRNHFDALITVVSEQVAVEIVSEETIWEETPWPGLRFQLRVGDENLQVDIGFGDPLVDGPIDIEIFPDQPVLACRAEALFAWKVHGLFERGPGRWRAKDLYDLLLMQRHTTLDRVRLAEAIQVAFESRECSFAIAGRFLSGEFGQSRGSRRKWRKLVRRRELPSSDEELSEVLRQVRSFVGPFLLPTVA